MCALRRPPMRLVASCRRFAYNPPSLAARRYKSSTSRKATSAAATKLSPLSSSDSNLATPQTSSPPISHIPLTALDFSASFSEPALLSARAFFTRAAPRQLYVSSDGRLPPSGYPEVCFLGRSNVGKSSLINALLNAKVCRVSAGPGHTRALLAYEVGNTDRDAKPFEIKTWLEDGRLVKEDPRKGRESRGERVVKERMKWRESEVRPYDEDGEVDDIEEVDAGAVESEDMSISEDGDTTTQQAGAGQTQSSQEILLPHDTESLPVSHTKPSTTRTAAVHHSPPTHAKPEPSTSTSLWDESFLPHPSTSSTTPAASPPTHHSSPPAAPPSPPAPTPPPPQPSPPQTLAVVDMPGYGHGSRSTFGPAVTRYLSKRTQLQRVFILINAEHGLKASDLTMLSELKTLRVPHSIALSKIDRHIFSTDPKSTRAKKGLTAAQLGKALDKARTLARDVTRVARRHSGEWLVGEALCVSTQLGYYQTLSRERGWLGVERLRAEVLRAVGLK